MLENILKPDWLERKPRFAFLIGFVYAIIGIVAAMIIFPKSQGIASIAFLSLLLVPSLNAMLRIEEIQDTKSRSFSVRRVFNDHADILQIYLLLFLGIFLAYGLFSIKFPNLLVSGLFDNQLRIIGVSGQAAGGINFASIFLNNFKVLIICLCLAVIIGAGSIFFLTWNASVWGVVFAYVASHSSNAFDAFARIFISVASHMMTEAAAYFFAIVAGGIWSQALLRERMGSPKFNYVMKDGFIFMLASLGLLLLGAILEVYVYKPF